VGFKVGLGLVGLGPFEGCFVILVGLGVWPVGFKVGLGLVGLGVLFRRTVAIICSINVSVDILSRVKATMSKICQYFSRSNSREGRRFAHPLLTLLARRGRRL